MRASRQWLLVTSLAIAVPGYPQQLCSVTNPLLSNGFESPQRDDSACAITITAPTIEQATTWTNSAAECDYFLANPVRIEAPLTIEPGVRIRAAADARLFLDNDVVALGTATDRIVFEGQTLGPGTWGGLADGGGAEQIQLDFVDIKDAGGCFSIGCPEAALDIRFAELSLRNSRIIGSGQAGLRVEEIAALDLQSNAFCGSVGTGVEVHPNLIAELDADSVYSAVAWPNQLDYVAIIDESDTTGTRWPKLDVPYLIDVLVTVDRGALSFDPGTSIAFRQAVDDQGARLRVVGPGLLLADGTAEEPIQFFGQPETPGRWRGLRLDDTGLIERNRLSHVVVEGGGTASVVESAGVQVDSDTLLEINDLVIRGSENYGIGCSESNFDLFEIFVGPGVVFEDNLLGDIDPACQPGLQ